MNNQIDSTELEYLLHLAARKDLEGLTWNDIRDLANEKLGYDYSQDRYRKIICKFRDDSPVTEVQESFIDYQPISTDTQRMRDERIQANALYRRMSREQTIIDIAKELASTMDANFKLPRHLVAVKTPVDKAAILQISDWHYGIEIDSFWNKYNPEIAKERIARLEAETIEICKFNGIQELHVVNLGDLIAGRIHTQLRINARIDVITQIMEVSELLAQMLSRLAEHFSVHYYDTLDNHSRLEPNLKESLDLESLARITTWYLKLRVPNIIVHENDYADDIITFRVLGHNVVAVHGDKDKPAKIIDGLSMLTKQHYDLALSAHYHHFSAEEKNETLLISNSSLMGTDDYAERLRLSAHPSQNLIIVTPDNVTHAVYRIELD